MLYVTKPLLSYSTFCVELQMYTNELTSWSQHTCHVWCFLFLPKQSWMTDWSIDCDWVRDLTVPMHLGFNWRALCAPYQFVWALLLCWSSRWPPDLYSWCPLAPRRRSPDTRVWVKPKFHIHKECGQRFHPLLHTSYTMDCLTALLDDDVSSGYYAQ